VESVADVQQDLPTAATAAAGDAFLSRFWQMANKDSYLAREREREINRVGEAEGVRRSLDSVVETPSIISRGDHVAPRIAHPLQSRALVWRTADRYHPGEYVNVSA